MATWSRSGALMSMTSPARRRSRLCRSCLLRSEADQPAVPFRGHRGLPEWPVRRRPAAEPAGMRDACRRRARQFATSTASCRASSAEGSVRGDAACRDQQTYNIVMVPRLWFLGQTTDCRVYQKMSTGDILQEHVPGCRPVRQSAARRPARSANTPSSSTRPICIRHAADGGGRLVLLLRAHRQQPQADRLPTRIGAFIDIAGAQPCISAAAARTATC